MIFSISVFALFASLNGIGIFLAPLFGIMQLNSSDYFVRQFPASGLSFRYVPWNKMTLSDGFYRPFRYQSMPVKRCNSYFFINGYLIRMLTNFIHQIMHIPSTEFLTLVALHILLTMGYFCFNFTKYAYNYLSEYPAFNLLIDKFSLRENAVLNLFKLIYVSLLEFATTILFLVQAIEICLILFRVPSPYLLSKISIWPLEFFIRLFQMGSYNQHTFSPYFNWWLWTCLNTIIYGLSINGLLEFTKTFLVLYYELAASAAASPLAVLKQRYLLEEPKPSKKSKSNSSLLLNAIVSTKVIIRNFLLGALHYLDIFELWLYRPEFSKVLWSSFNHQFYSTDTSVSVKTVTAQILTI